MKKLIIGSVLIIAVLMLSGLATPVSAGVEPSPFRDINVLNSMVNELGSVERRTGFILAHPPDPVKPGLIGDLNRLDAMGDDLERLDNRLGGLIGTHPINSQDLPEDVIAAYGDVKAGAQGIVDDINAYLRDPTGGNPSNDFDEALIGLRSSAQQIITTINTYLIGQILS